MVERGTGCGPAASAFSARPMHAPELWPMHGMPSISGTSGLAAVVLNSGGDTGTMNGVHVVVNVSISSPDWHCATDVVGAGAEEIAMVGSAATAKMKPPARASRRIANEDVAIPQV